MKATIIIRNHDDFMVFLIGYNRKKSDCFAYKMFPIPFLIIRKFYSFGFFLFFFLLRRNSYILFKLQLTKKKEKKGTIGVVFVVYCVSVCVCVRERGLYCDVFVAKKDNR